MVLSLTIVPVGATSDENVPTVTLETVSFTEADVTGFTEGEAKTDVRPGETIAVKSKLTNTTDETIWVTGFSQKLSYDSSVFEFYTFKYKPRVDKNNTTKVGPIIGKASETDIPADWNGVQNSDTEGVAIWNGTGVEPIELTPGSTLTLGYVLLKAKTNIENGNYDIHFNLENDNNYIKSSQNESGTNDTNIQGIDFSENNKATLSVVGGVTPTITTVTLNPSTVTVNGTNAQTVQAKATSAKGTDLTNSVTWSIGTPENGGGVSIAENGTITVAANAKAGAYTVYANKNSSGGGGGGSGSTNRSQSAAARSTVQGSAYATLTVKRNPQVLTSIEITGDATIAVPTAAEQTNNLNLTAIGKDQYGENMDITGTPTWTITSGSAAGVTLSGTTLSVAKNASAGTVTVQATVDGKTATKEITITKAASKATAVVVNGSDTAIEIPGAAEANKTAAFTAIVTDQYGDVMQNADVTWSIENGASGISVNNGTVTVSKDASVITNSQEVTLVATCDGVRGTKQITVKRATPVATSIKVFKDNSTTPLGDNDTIIIPSTSTPNTYTYSAKVYDQYGSEMTSAQPTMTFATADTYVTYDSNSGKVTVKQGAQKDKTYTLTVSYTGLNSTITITAKDIDITWPTVSKKTGTYGDKWSDIVKYSGGSATLNSAKVDGTFTLKNADTVPNVGAKYQFVFKSTDGKYTVESSAYDAEIARKSVTITGLSASDKEYNGSTTASVSGTATISGKLDKDNPTVTPGTASFADKNAGTNKTVTFIGYALSGDAAGNYELSGQPAPVKANITQKELTVTAGNLNFTKVYDGTTSVGTKSGNLELTDVISGDTVSVADGYTAAYADANVGTNKNVEVTGLTLTGTDAGNYKLKSTTLTVVGNSITKATYGDKTATSEAKYGTTRTLNLSQYLVSDAEVDNITSTDDDSVLDGTPSVTEQILTYKFKNDASLKNKTATITIPVTSGNYENYSITVTVTVLDKLTQNDFKFAADAQTKTYGDSKFTYAATGAVNGSAVTYSSSNTDVATVNEITGEVTILKAGETIITAAATATDDYAAATQSYTLTVNKAKLTVRPKSYTIRVGDTLPTPEVEYVGLKNNDKAEDVAKLDTGKKLDLKIKNKDNGTLENSNTTGTYEIVFEEKPAFQTTGNYEIEVVDTGKLTINSRSSGSSGGSGVSTYPVSVTTPKNGKVSVDPRNAAKGAAVTVTVTPDSGYEMDKLTVTDASGKTISITDKGNGKFTFTMPNGKVSVSATFKQTTVTPPSTGFVDVPASAYYADAVKWAVEKGITTGTSATTFSPEASCTRAQMVTFLWRAAGSPAPKATTTAFTDLDKSAYYYDAVLWAVEQGITTGTSATTFSPNATVTRGQTVTFLYRFAGQPAVSGSSSFTDVNSSDYYAAAVQWAKEQGITSGTSATTFSPTNDCTRGQIVTFLYRQLAK